LDESKEHGGSAEVGQFWTPFIPLSGSLLHADSHPRSSLHEQPSEQWQSQSNGFLKWSSNILWNVRYALFRNWLDKDRGLQEKTIKDANLGWLPEDWYTERKIWGLPEKIKDDGTTSQVWMPAGLVIPCFHEGHLQRLKIRRHNITEGDRYHIIPGSSSIPMILGEGDVFIIVESELDALLLKQEAGDLVGVIALGSAMIKPDEKISNMLRQAKKVLISLDSDETGAKISWKWWLNKFHNAIRWPIIKGKDPTEAHLKGLNLRNWVRAGILSERQQESIVESSPMTAEKTDAAPLEMSATPGSIKGSFEHLKDSPIISIKIAATGEDPFKDKITSIVLCAPDHTPILLAMTESPVEETLNSLKQLLGSSSEKVLYDAKKTLHFLHGAGLDLNGPIYDVMLADKILIAGIGDKDRCLKDLVCEYIETSARKDLMILSMTDEAVMLLKLREATFAKLTQDNLMDTAILEFDCIRSVAGMERDGFRVDENKLREMLQQLSARKGILEQALKEDLGNINLNSPKQVKEALIAKGIIVKDTSKETLIPYVAAHLFLTDFLTYKTVTHDISQVNKLLTRINSDTRRLHPQYCQIGTPTGRFSSSDPNIQGIPKAEDFRSCFIAADGHKLVIADYSQIELRIAAEISKDKRMIDAYQKGEDLHRLTASLVTGKSIDEITKDERSAAKAVNFGLIYAMGAQGLKDSAFNTYGVSMTLQEAAAFRSKFLSAYQGISQWHQKVQRELPRETRTLGNRRRVWRDKLIITELLNSPVQGTSADITKKALCLLHERLQGSGIKIIGCIHDEIIIETPVAEIETAAQILHDSMVDAGRMYLKDVPVVVDVSVADNWFEK